jgi:hypothetical protein
MFITRSIIEGTKTASQWENDLKDIAPTTRKNINMWVHRAREGKGFSDTMGRAAVIDTTSRTAIRREARSHKRTHGVVDAKEMTELVFGQAVATYNRCHFVRNCNVEKPVYNTIAKHKSLANVKDGNGEGSSNARLDAEADLRSAISLGVACELMIPLTCHDISLNSDATQFQVGGDSGGGNKVACCYVADDEPDDSEFPESSRRPSELKVQKRSGSNLTAFFVKYYCLCTCSGLVAPPIYMIANDDMDKNEVDIHHVPSIGLHGLENGWIIFMKTRVPPVPFYEWFLIHVLLPWIAFIREQRGISADKFAWFQQDGETEQIDIYKRPEIQALCEREKVIITKSSASRTKYEQACDAGNMFKAPKSAMKKSTEADISDMTREMASVEVAFAAHEQKYGWKIKAGHRAPGKKGILRVVKMLRGTMNERIVKKSFELVGIRKATGEQGYDMTTILNNCTGYVSDEVREICIPGGPSMTHLASIMKRKGELAESDYDAVGIPRQATIRDVSRVTHQKRFVFLTHCNYMRNQQLRADAAEAEEADRKRAQEVKKAEAAAKKEAATLKKEAAAIKRADMAAKKQQAADDKAAAVLQQHAAQQQHVAQQQHK